MSFLLTLFRWPDGIVVGNLIASALWAAPSLLHLHKKLERHHQEHMNALREVKHAAESGTETES